MIQQTKMAGGVDTDQWEIVAERVTHPVDVPGVGFGALVRNRRTGVYGIMQAGVFRSVPQRWAADVAAKAAGQ